MPGVREQSSSWSGGHSSPIILLLLEETEMMVHQESQTLIPQQDPSLQPDIPVCLCSSGNL